MKIIEKSGLKSVGYVRGMKKNNVRHDPSKLMGILRMSRGISGLLHYKINWDQKYKEN